jgi:hypothetical protein
MSQLQVRTPSCLRFLRGSPLRPPAAPQHHRRLHRDHDEHDPVRLLPRLLRGGRLRRGRAGARDGAHLGHLGGRGPVQLRHPGLEDGHPGGAALARVHLGELSARAPSARLRDASPRRRRRSPRPCVDARSRRTRRKGTRRAPRRRRGRPARSPPTRAGPTWSRQRQTRSAPRRRRRGSRSRRIPRGPPSLQKRSEDCGVAAVGVWLVFCCRCPENQLCKHVFPLDGTLRRAQTQQKPCRKRSRRHPYLRVHRDCDHGGPPPTPGAGGQGGAGQGGQQDVRRGDQEDRLRAGPRQRGADEGQHGAHQSGDRAGLPAGEAGRGSRVREPGTGVAAAAVRWLSYTAFCAAF